MKFVIPLLAVLALAGCKEATASSDVVHVDYCKPHWVATSPEGVKLYRVDRHCERVNWDDVYFSAKGAQWSTGGKTPHKMYTPAAE